MEFIDYAQLKRDISMEQAVAALDIKNLKRKGNQLRGPCPLGFGGDRAFTITLDYPNKDGTLGRFYCHAEGCTQNQGDMLQLVAKVERISVHEAAIELKKAFQTNSPRESRKLPAKGLEYLVGDHPAVLALGLTPETAQRLGVGYANKGIMRGRVCFPLRSEDGTLIAYVGYAAELDPPLKFPVKFL